MRHMAALCLVITLAGGCASNPKPRDVEASVAIEGLEVASRTSELSDIVAMQLRDGDISGPDAQIVKSRITGINLRGKELGRYLHDMDTARTPESAFQYRKLAIDTIASMRRELTLALKPLNPSDERYRYLFAVAGDIDGTLDHMATRLGVEK